MTNKEHIQAYAELEEKGIFDQDINPVNPDLCLPVTKDYPYIKKGFFHSIADFFKHTFVIAPFSWYQNKFVFKTKVVGRENLKNIDSAILTCNHFNIYDCLAVRHAVRHKMKFCVAEFNNRKGFLGSMMRAAGILPLSNKFGVMKYFSNAVEHHLLHNNYVLFYPEKAMWYMYDKPRPYKEGAFHFAVKFEVPVIPIFITFRDSGKTGKDGLPVKYLTVNILKPVYSKENLPAKENIDCLKKTCFQQCKDRYEQFYKKQLVYNIKNRK